jgi:FKBP-type peptidyl-prolyl cis-trans isomerase 2
VLSPGGVEVDVAVTNVSDNQVRIDFVTPASGQAIII